jgi:uncharacterized protein with HEPN domain
MDERTAERLLYLDATVAEVGELSMRGRRAYDTDIAVARACQFDIVRLAADLERLGETWIDTHPSIPWQLIRGMRNRIARDYRTVDDDIVWEVVTEHVPALGNVIAKEIEHARQLLA